MRRRVLVAALAALAAVLILVPAAGARVLRVGKFHGIRGQFRSIQAAVNAARPGDWVLIGPGDYKTTRSHAPKGHRELASGVLVTRPDIWIRGMNRNTVIVDGTKPGSGRCSGRRGAQNFGPAHRGLNGIMVWKADNVWVQNLTACNFLHGSGDTGNEIWWNGNESGTTIGGHGLIGSYLTTTSSFYGGERTAAQYGVFTSHWSGGTLDRLYASNFNDSGFYIGGCKQVCNQVIDHARGQFSALGYSGTNSGGRLLIENSEFDHNKDGFDTNSENADFPSPQNGNCPGKAISPITHTRSCWVFMHNFVHDNNNANVPAQGSASFGPVGTGMSVSGARNDTIIHNRFQHNDAWGMIVVPFPDSGKPCTGGSLDALGPGSCLFDEFGDAVLHNTFSHNGSYGHPTNGDIAQLNLNGGEPTDCYRGNTEAGGGAITTSPAGLQQSHPQCNGQPAPANPNQSFLFEVLCNSQLVLFPGTPRCPSGPYPRRTKVIMHRLPRHLKTMPNPCAGVPANPWCRPKKT